MCTFPHQLPLYSSESMHGIFHKQQKQLLHVHTLYEQLHIVKIETPLAETMHLNLSNKLISSLSGISIIILL